MIASTEDGGAVEAGIVGKEGATDISVVLGDDIASHHGIVELAGSALKLNAAALREELRRDGELRSVLLMHARSLSALVRMAVATGHDPIADT